MMALVAGHTRKPMLISSGYLGMEVLPVPLLDLHLISQDMVRNKSL